MSESAPEILRHADTVRAERRLRESVDLFAAALRHPGGGLTVAQRRHAYLQALRALTRIGEWVETESLARAGLEELPQEPYLHQCLGEALMQLERKDEAEAALRRALEIHPEQDGARALLGVLHSFRPGKRPKMPSPWPSRIRQFEDPASTIRQHLLRNRPRDPFIRPGVVFQTLGSCFAQNLANGLKAAGYRAYQESIGEEINSTFANRYLLEWVEHGPIDPRTRAMDDAFGPASRERLRRSFAASDIFVMTLGVAASYFDEDGEFIFVTQHTRTTAETLAQRTMRTTTVAENIENIGRIIDSVRRLGRPDMKIVLTVSPVPMAGTNEFGSAVEADCISKSTLRVACHEVVTARANEGVIYWPSFEIVRWLGPHFGPEIGRIYGGDDGNTRHVSGWLVELIISLFLEFHAEAAAE
jgi:tetratricopeptide (TPR) repeat protein